jgi:hypothetical protein
MTIWSAARESMDEAAITDRMTQLSAMSERFREMAAAMGFASDAACETICEERLVVINGRLERQVVCRTICPD